MIIPRGGIVWKNVVCFENREGEPIIRYRNGYNDWDDQYRVIESENVVMHLVAIKLKRAGNESRP